MLFNSLEFLIFFPIVTALYFILPYKFRTLLLLFASCLFYMAFIPAYIFVLGITILIDYFAGILIENSSSKKQKKIFLIVSILSTCMVLFVFKYFNFFNKTCFSIAHYFHWNYPISSLDVILPIGLSFHTFQSLSYVIEVYRGQQKVERNFLTYALYVMFYPQLVAGPIERPQHLLHQFYEKHDFDYPRVTEGLRLMLWGLFKKIVIADRLSLLVDTVYNSPHNFSGLSFLIATVFFAFQIYCDFSGYSDVAIGAAQVMGFRLMKNFNQPYLSRSIRDFWSRWHISLSTWFRDYVYIPLGGRKVSAPRWAFNIFLTFLLSGMWHGANWTFFVWGALHGFYYLVSAATAKGRRWFVEKSRVGAWPILHHAIQVSITFGLVCFSWIFFRANTLSDAFFVIGNLFTGWHDPLPFKVGNVTGLGLTKPDFILAVCLIGLLMVVQIIQQFGSLRDRFARLHLVLRWPVYATLVLVIMNLGITQTVPFIYFQF